MINKCTFIGNLGKDPDYKVLESGHKVASFSIACSRKVKNKENGETKEYTEWIPIVAWDNLAEIISQLARKGSQVYVEGPKTYWERWAMNSYFLRFAYIVYYSSHPIRYFILQSP